MRVKVNAFVAPLAILLAFCVVLSPCVAGQGAFSAGLFISGQASQDKKDQGPSAQTPPPAPPSSSAPANGVQPQPKSPPPKSNVVWVNTDSKLYHRPGSKWYGKTRHGKYMTEGDAIKAGYHAAEKE